MRSIIGLQTPDGGEIEVLGEKVATLDDEAAKDIRRRWGVLFQDGALFSSLTVAENIEVPMREFFHLDQALMDEIASYKIAMVGLPDIAGMKFPSELSGGMRKRAGLARALALDPDLLFLDEPTAGLDPIGAAAFDELIKLMRDTLGLTVFLITHDLDTLYAICDRVAVLADGVMPGRNDPGTDRLRSPVGARIFLRPARPGGGGDRCRPACGDRQGPRRGAGNRGGGRSRCRCGRRGSGVTW